MFFKFIILAHLFAFAFTLEELDFEAIFEWNYMNYTWPSKEAWTEAIDNGQYILENNVLIGVKWWKDKLYLATPRFKEGVPVTLSVIPATPVNGDTSPLLEPFPNWDWQTEGNCSAFQLVHSLEIDPFGRMWIIDSGRTGILSDTPVSRCPARLVILDLENNNTVLRDYIFPEEVAAYDSVILNDIALDHEGGSTAFITDSSKVDPGIIVYSFEDNKAWKVRHNTMKFDKEATDVVVNGTTIHATTGVNGITITPPAEPNRVVYYSPMPTFFIYTIPLSVLKNSSQQDYDDYVKILGRKSSQSGGMIMSNQGVLYFGILNADALAAWDSKNSTSFTYDYRQVFQDHVRSQIEDSYTFDGSGHLWYISNRLQNYFAGTVDITEPNSRLLRAMVGAKSYQYLENGTAPKLS